MSSTINQSVNEKLPRKKNWTALDITFKNTSLKGPLVLSLLLLHSFFLASQPSFDIYQRVEFKQNRKTYIAELLCIESSSYPDKSWSTWRVWDGDSCGILRLGDSIASIDTSSFMQSVHFDPKKVKVNVDEIEFKYQWIDYSDVFGVLFRYDGDSVIEDILHWKDQDVIWDELMVVCNGFQATVGTSNSSYILRNTDAKYAATFDQQSGDVLVIHYSERISFKRSAIDVITGEILEFEFYTPRADLSGIYSIEEHKWKYLYSEQADEKLVITTLYSQGDSLFGFLQGDEFASSEALQQNRVINLSEDSPNWKNGDEVQAKIASHDLRIYDGDGIKSICEPDDEPYWHPQSLIKYPDLIQKVEIDVLNETYPMHEWCAQLPQELTGLERLKTLGYSGDYKDFDGCLNKIVERSPNLNSLSLHGFYLDENFTLTATNIENLNLSFFSTWADTLPFNISELDELKHLSVSGISGPEFIGQKGMPAHFWRINSLESFTIRDQCQAEFPSVSSLTKLQSLCIECTEENANLKNAYPLDLNALSKLDSLTLSGLGLDRIPPEIEQLTELRYLDLRQNQISELPNAIRQLKNLRFIDLRGNPISVTPLNDGVTVLFD